MFTFEINVLCDTCPKERAQEIFTGEPSAVPDTDAVLQQAGWEGWKILRTQGGALAVCQRCQKDGRAMGEKIRGNAALSESAARQNPSTREARERADRFAPATGSAPE